MKRSDMQLSLGLALVAVALVAPRYSLAQANFGNASLGRELFERQFEATNPADTGGDGLGPVFNHVSCAACHKQGGLGGAGPVDVNAAMLSVDLTRLESRNDLPKLARLIWERGLGSCP